MHEKVIFIIPGFRQRSKSRAYREITKILANEGYFPIVVSLSWDKTTVSQNTEHFIEEFEKAKGKKRYILGFSFGAMIGLIASTKVEVDGLVLCSLSPYFSEDLPKIGYHWKPSTLARYQDFAGLSYAKIASQTKAKKVLMLYGEKEAKSLVRRVVGAFGKIPAASKRLIPIEKTEHEIGDKNYLATIHWVSRNLL